MRLDDFVTATARYLDSLVGEPLASRVLADHRARKLSSALVSSGQARTLLLTTLGKFIGLTRAWTELSRDQDASVLSARHVSLAIARSAEMTHRQFEPCVTCRMATRHCPKTWAVGMMIFSEFLERLSSMTTSSVTVHGVILVEVSGSSNPVPSGGLN